MKARWMMAILIGLVPYTQAQDTLTIMSYNILNYPSSSPTKADTLKPIIKHIQPDILMINELESSVGATTILTNALNVDGVTNYQKAIFFAGPNTNNMLYYNSEKLVLHNQHEIPTALRNISEYVLYLKTPMMNANTDTVFLYCYSAHLKASSGTTNEQKRFQEATLFKSYLNGKPHLENVILGGDFNVYSSAEPAYETLLNGGDMTLYDPISSSGNWHNDSSFAMIHTQSTRLGTISGGGAGGGMDDRFDFILFNHHLQTGEKGVTYLSGSYKAIGNDGNHFNQSINVGANTAAPSNVIDALYYMSDHLPVVLKAIIPANVGVEGVKNNSDWKGYFANNYFHFIAEQPQKELEILLMDIKGRTIKSQIIKKTKTFNLDLNYLPKGIYFVKVIDVHSANKFEVYQFSR